jgi:hypothetical protein
MRPPGQVGKPAGPHIRLERNEVIVMRSYHIQMGAGISGLELRHGPEPTPGPHQVGIRVRAVSLNFRELMIAVRGA